VQLSGTYHYKYAARLKGFCAEDHLMSALAIMLEINQTQSIPTNGGDADDHSPQWIKPRSVLYFPVYLSTTRKYVQCS
jgi:hypothetical protein